MKKFVFVLCVLFAVNTYGQNKTMQAQVKKVELDTLKEVRLNKKQEVKKIEGVKNTKTLNEMKKSKKQKVKKIEFLKNTKTLKEKSINENQSVLNSNPKAKDAIIGYVEKNLKDIL